MVETSLSRFKLDYILFLDFLQISHYLIRYGEESQQVSLDKLAHLINATREQLDKAVYVETTEELTKYTADVR